MLCYVSRVFTGATLTLHLRTRHFSQEMGWRVGGSIASPHSRCGKISETTAMQEFPGAGSQYAVRQIWTVRVFERRSSNVPESTAARATLAR